MSANQTTPEIGLFAGVREILGKALSAKPSEHHFCSRETANAHAAEKSGKPQRPDLTQVIEDLWKQIVTNWVEGGCQWSGGKNWCWRKSEILNREEERSEDDEVSLNRRLTRKLKDRPWANETPTGSGMGNAGREPGGVDLAYLAGHRHVMLIELKTKLDSNPMSTAFQLIGYGLFLILARLTHKRLIHKLGQIKIADEWEKAELADLRVLAPTKFYTSYLTLGWFEADLNNAIATFGKKRVLPMTFEFRAFDESFLKDPTETKLLDALERPIKWK